MKKLLFIFTTCLFFVLTSNAQLMYNAQKTTKSESLNDSKSNLNDSKYKDNNKQSYKDNSKQSSNLSPLRTVLPATSTFSSKNNVQSNNIDLKQTFKSKNHTVSHSATYIGKKNLQTNNGGTFSTTNSNKIKYNQKSSTNNNNDNSDNQNNN